MFFVEWLNDVRSMFGSSAKQCSTREDNNNNNNKGLY